MLVADSYVGGPGGPPPKRIKFKKGNGVCILRHIQVINLVNNFKGILAKLCQ